MLTLSKEAREWLAKQCMPEVVEALAALDSAVAEVARYRQRLLDAANEEPATGWLRPGEVGYENTPEGARVERDRAVAQRDGAIADCREAARVLGANEIETCVTAAGRVVAERDELRARHAAELAEANRRFESLRDGLKTDADAPSLSYGSCADCKGSGRDIGGWCGTCGGTGGA